MVENDDGQIEVYHQTEAYNKYFILKKSHILYNGCLIK